MGQFDDELAALKHRRQMEHLHESPVIDRLGEAAEMVGAASAIGSVLIAPAAPALAPLGAAASGLGLFQRALRSGRPKAEKMIEDLESATASQIKRIWVRLDSQEARQVEFEARLNSPAAETAILNECFHGLRTSDSQKHGRLAVVTVNSIFENDMGEESLDKMMRAAVELTEKDIDVLRAIYKMQSYMFSPSSIEVQQASRISRLQREWQEWWSQNISKFQGLEGMGFNNSCARLQASGLITSMGAKSFAASPTTGDYELLLDGKKFYERIQETV